LTLSFPPLYKSLAPGLGSKNRAESKRGSIKPPSIQRYKSGILVFYQGEVSQTKNYRSPVPDVCKSAEGGEEQLP